MTCIFISDLHLDDPTSAKFAAFKSVLSQAIEAQAQIYVLGDLAEVWIGDDDDSEFADALREALKTAAQRTDVALMPGNRDFLYSPQIATDTGVRLLPDPYVIETQNGSVLLAHGDAYCTQDTAYQQMRKTFRSEAGVARLMSMTLEERRAFARELRGKSKVLNQFKSEVIMDVTRSAIDSATKEHGCQVMIHGHTHRPAIHPESWGKRYVLGSWESCGWVIHMSDHNIELDCFAIQ